MNLRWCVFQLNCFCQAFCKLSSRTSLLQERVLQQSISLTKWGNLKPQAISPKTEATEPTCKSSLEEGRNETSFVKHLLLKSINTSDHCSGLSRGGMSCVVSKNNVCVRKKRKYRVLYFLDLYLLYAVFFFLQTSCGIQQHRQTLRGGNSANGGSFCAISLIIMPKDQTSTLWS